VKSTTTLIDVDSKVENILLELWWKVDDEGVFHELARSESIDGRSVWALTATNCTSVD
jgi:hypothetical protein